MQILALETSGPRGKAALLCDDRLVEESATSANSRVAKELAPTIASLLKSRGVSILEIDLVAVSLGPGSFTGLRFGVTTAKTLAFALNRPIWGVPTFDAIARQAPVSGETTPLYVIADAFRGQIFSQKFHVNSGRWQAAGTIETSDQETWLGELCDVAVLTGPFVARLASRLPKAAILVDEGLREPSAATIGRIAREAHASGLRADVMQFAPLYVRPSAAEEKAAARQH